MRTTIVKGEVQTSAIPGRCPCRDHAPGIHTSRQRIAVHRFTFSGISSLIEPPPERLQLCLIDLFHANWPYGGELLFLAKAFPNVVMNFCWAHAIDPIYCQTLMREAVSAVPHAKVHVFGADYGGFGLPPGGGYVDRAWAHLQLALDNMAIALSDFSRLVSQCQRQG